MFSLAASARAPRLVSAIMQPVQHHSRCTLINAHSLALDVCVWSRYALLMHRGSAAAAKDTAGAAKAQAIVFKVDHDNYYLNAGMQSVEYIHAR